MNQDNGMDSAVALSKYLTKDDVSKELQEVWVQGTLAAEEAVQ